MIYSDCFSLSPIRGAYHKPLFLRRQAPRPRTRTGLPPIRRGASLPANPCSFVDGHHALGHEPAFLQSGVVLHSPQTLVPSSTDTTPPGRPHLHRRWKRLGRFLLLPTKKQKGAVALNSAAAPFSWGVFWCISWWNHWKRRLLSKNKNLRPYWEAEIHGKISI